MNLSAMLDIGSRIGGLEGGVQAHFDGRPRAFDWLPLVKLQSFKLEGTRKLVDGEGVVA